jgi:hypothetical protein
MTQKEKAEELFEKMLYNDGDKYHHCSHYVGKNCALIAVDEMLNFQENLVITEGSLAYQYWQEVKTEIEKL